MPKILFDRGRGHRVPIHLWARDASSETIAQLERIASRPYVALRVAAMADAHVSEGVAVGTVFATEHTVVPRALGGDLGCGVSAIRLASTCDHLADDRSLLDRIVADLVRAIPAGDQLHRKPLTNIPDRLREPTLSTSKLEHARELLLGKHLGTLGGGNHFLELDRDAENHTWLLVHSGSRGVGGAIAAHHVRAAEAVDSDPLAGLPLDSPAGADYLNDQAFALEFAKANRLALAKRAIEIIANVAQRDPLPIDPSIDIHHNFIAKERWDDRDLYIHRKGAVAVPSQERAIIPGSMATASYIVTGLGCAASFGSCSHGAGRVLTRREARSKILPKHLERTMSRIAWPAHLAKRLVEEAPTAYRDITTVLDDQSDLVERNLRLEPIAVLKG